MYKEQKIGIYKIENIVNHKIYIGQSKHIYRRWVEHRYDSKTKDTPLYRSIRKYGIENFHFTILEECNIDELPYREEYYINKYNSFVPEGYNINLPETHYTNMSIPDKYKEIISLLKTTMLTLTEIGARFNLSKLAISRINNGISWRLQDETYPIRRTYGGYDKDQIIPLLQQGYKVKEIGIILGVTTATIQGYLQTNNIHTSDFRKRLTSNKKTYQYSPQGDLIKIYNSIKEAAEELYKSNQDIQYNSILCGIKRNLNKGFYKNYKWTSCPLSGCEDEEE